MRRSECQLSLDGYIYVLFILPLVRELHEWLTCWLARRSWAVRGPAGLNFQILRLSVSPELTRVSECLLRYPTEVHVRVMFLAVVTLSKVDVYFSCAATVID